MPSLQPAPTEAPQGELTLRTVAMPADTSEKNYIFGGWILSQMDMAASLKAWLHSGLKVVTVAADGIQFHKPIYVSDEVSCYARVVKVGRTSMEVFVEVWVRSGRQLTPSCATTGIFTFVAIDDETGTPIEITNKLI